MKLKRLLSTILAFGLIFSGVACDKQSKKREFDNIILVIGDGMGENHILNALTYFDLDVPVFMADQVGYINTNSLDTDGPTDSAAGGTALATGQKVHNSNLSQLDGQDLTRITDIAKDAGMKTGVITTDKLSGATPASFSAHARNRTFTTTIANTQAESDINLLIGQDDLCYTNTSLFTEAGYSIFSTLFNPTDTLNSLKQKEKVVGLISRVGSEYIKGNEGHYQLKDMTKYAVEFLENDKGFFLMVEGAYIDKYSHNNDLHGAMSELRSLIDTIEYLYEYAADGKTAIFITADHETGGLQKATDKESMSNRLYTVDVHTSTPVPLFVKNYTLDITKFGYEAGVTPENTMVFEACKSIIKG